jgi:hypothetical protein
MLANPTWSVGDLYAPTPSHPFGYSPGSGVRQAPLTGHLKVVGTLRNTGYGQLGTGTTTDSSSPVTVTGF